MIKVRYDIPQRTTTTLSDGTPVEVSWSIAAGFAARWGRQAFRGARLSDVLRRIEEHRARDRASTARARGVRATSPRPALLLPALEAVGVRGVHSQSGYALITRVDGASGPPVPFTQLLRPLDEGEAAKVRAAYAAAVDAGRAKSGIHVVDAYSAPGLLDTEVVVTYDTDREVYVATADGETAEAASVKIAVDQIEDRLCRKRWPFTLIEDLDGGRQVTPAADYPETEQYGTEGLFTTREEADRYLVRLHAARAAQQNLRDLLTEYRFDPASLRSEPAQ